MKKTETVEQYLGRFDGQVLEKMLQLRTIITEIAPQAQEKIHYQIPGYFLEGKPLVYFAGYKKHIGFYATPNGHSTFKEEFSKYKQGKGSVQFPITDELPIELIKKVVLFRIEFLNQQLKTK